MRRLLLPLLLALVCVQFTAHGISRPDGWDEDTHGRDAEPDYGRVFPVDRVTRLDIDVSSTDWQAVMDDMTSMAGAFAAERPQGGQGIGGQGAGGQEGGGQGGGGQGGPGQGGPGQGVILINPSAESIAACSGKVVADACPVADTPNGRCTQVGPTTLACVGLPPGAVINNVGGPGGAPTVGPIGNVGRGANGADDVDIFPRTPIYIPATVRFDGQTFRQVGFRLKGNSSLANAWRSGVDKFPFRLNFDELQDRFPEIRDQTFFGFSNLAFTSNGTDTSFLRHRVVTDLFRQAGVPAPRTAYVRVFMNRGSESFYMGLYTLTEVPGSPFLVGLFGSDDGNLYKPVGTGGRWTQFFQLSFPKKTNGEAEDWTDIQDAIEALNASRSNAATWRARLEARFEVNGFLRWLALNTIVGNFDAYGGLSAHNYYLYGSPRHRDRLFWIAWDHDLAMNGNTLAGGNAGSGTIDLFLDGTAANWPLIRYLLDDAVYRAVYRGHVADLLNTTFEPGRLISRLRAEEALIRPYVIGADGEVAGHTYLTNPAQLASGLATLETYVRARHAAATAALAVAR